MAAIIEASATGRVLVVGSPPPAGRDCDLLARETDRRAIELGLQGGGFEPIGNGWVRFDHEGTVIVELLTPADWELSDVAAEELFAQALPLDGHAPLFVPSPAHQLLILARKLPRTPLLLERAHRERIRDALSRAPDAWMQARAQAADWGVRARLRALQARSARPPRRGWPPRYLRRPRRGATIALSGLDGVGKSTQAQALLAELTRLGHDAAVVWTPVGNNLSLRRFAGAIKAWLARLPVGPLAHADGETAQRHLLSQTEDGVPVGGRWRRRSAWVWATVITLANAITYRRAARGARMGGRIVIYDRYVLDTIVDLRFSYSPTGRLPLQEALVRLIAPAPRCAFLLEARPEIAHQRKPDWTLPQTRLRAELYRSEFEHLGVRRIDAEHPADAVTAKLLREVLLAIGNVRCWAAPQRRQLRRDGQ